jgi:hypothetical protein
MSDELLRARRDAVKVAERRLVSEKRIVKFVWLLWAAVFVIELGTLVGAFCVNMDLLAMHTLTLPLGAGAGWWTFEAGESKLKARYALEDANERLTDYYAENGV